MLRWIALSGRLAGGGGSGRIKGRSQRAYVGGVPVYVMTEADVDHVMGLYVGQVMAVVDALVYQPNDSVGYMPTTFEPQVTRSRRTSCSTPSSQTRRG